jgi:hypothetical protein
VRDNTINKEEADRDEDPPAEILGTPQLLEIGEHGGSYFPGNACRDE